MVLLLPNIVDIVDKWWPHGLYTNILHIISRENKFKVNNIYYWICLRKILGWKKLLLSILASHRNSFRFFSSFSKINSLFIHKIIDLFTLILTILLIVLTFAWKVLLMRKIIIFCIPRKFSTAKSYIILPAIYSDPKCCFLLNSEAEAKERGVCQV